MFCGSAKPRRWKMRLLRSPESPIVLLRRKPSGSSALASSVAPGNPMLGVMLPYTPLHHLLMRALGFAVVATSGNLSDEPICTDEREAVERLREIADLLLVHDRPILRHVDDSIVRLMAGREMVMRRARGFAPLPVMLDEEMPTLLGVGAHQKNTVALSVGRQVFLSQHIGDLETEPASQAFERVVESLEGLYDAKPETRGLRPASQLHLHRLREPGLPRAGAGAASLCPRAGLHGGERSEGSGAGRGLGRQRLGPGWHGVGRRVFKD